MQRGIGAVGIAGFVAAAVSIGWATGRLDQRIFDDEVLTLLAVEGRGYGELIRFHLGGHDVHPPLSFLWFRLLHDLGAPHWLQRGLSLAMAAAGFALVLDLVWRRLPDGATASRALAVVLFLGAPLLYGMGAALRWYPLLALPVALAIWSALGRGRPTMAAAICLGLAANVSFLAIVPALAYLVWRYFMAGRFDAAWDGPFLIVLGVLAAPGLLAFAMSVEIIPAQFDTNPLAALGMTAIGLAGGYGLGLTQSALAVPLVLLGAAGLFGGLLALRRPSIGDLLGVAILMAVLCLPIAAAGFAKPRSFLFMLPFLLSAVVLGGFSLPWRNGHALATAIASLAVTAAALWLLNFNDHPFKRNLHIEDGPIVQTVRDLARREQAIVVSSEPGLGRRLRAEGYCVLAASLPGGCERRDAPVIVMIDDGTLAHRQGFAGTVAGLARGHRLAEQRLFGNDEDAPLKSMLGARHVPKFLVSLSVYRRDPL